MNLLLLLSACANVVDYSGGHGLFIPAPTPTDDTAVDTGTPLDSGVDSPADTSPPPDTETGTVDTVDTVDTGTPPDTSSVDTGSSGWAQGTAVTLSGSDWVSWVRAGDLTGDGRPDLAWSTFSSYDPHRIETIHVMVQQADGSFTEVFTDTPGPAVPLDGNGAVVDVDEDGINDLVFANSDGFAWYRGDTGGAFGTATQVSGYQNNDLIAADFDADGHVDLLTDDGLGHSVYWKGDGTGSFTDTQDWNPGYGPWCDAKYVSGDFDGDGDLDLALSQSTDDVAVFWSDGSTFDTTPELIPDATLGTVYDLAAADLDGDGDDEIGITYIDSPYTTTALAVYTYDGGAWLTDAVSVGAESSGNLEPADPLGDGQETFVEVSGAFDLATFVSAPGGVFSSVGTALPLPVHPDWRENYDRDKVAWSDLDGDGCADLIAFGASTERTLVYGACP